MDATNIGVFATASERHRPLQPDLTSRDPPTIGRIRQLPPIRDLPISSPSNGPDVPAANLENQAQAALPWGTLSDDHIAFGAASDRRGSASISPPEHLHTQRPFQLVEELCQLLPPERCDITSASFSALLPYLPGPLLAQHCLGVAEFGEAYQAQVMAMLGPHLESVPRHSQSQIIDAALAMEIPQNRADALYGLTQGLHHFSSAQRTACLQASYALNPQSVGSIALEGIAQSIHTCSETELQDFIQRVAQCDDPLARARVLSSMAQSFPQLGRRERQAALLTLYLPLPEDAKAIAARGLSASAAQLDQERIFMAPLRSFTTEEAQGTMIEHLAPALGQFFFQNQVNILQKAFSLVADEPRAGALHQLTIHADRYHPEIQASLVNLRLATTDPLEQCQAIQALGESMYGFSADLQQTIKEAAFRIEDPDLQGAIIASLAQSAFGFPPAMRQEFIHIATQWEDAYEKAFALRGLAHHPQGVSESEQSLLLDHLAEVTDPENSSLDERDITDTLKAFAPAIPSYTRPNIRRWLDRVRQRPLEDQIEILGALIPKTTDCSEQNFNFLLHELCSEPLQDP